MRVSFSLTYSVLMSESVLILRDSSLIFEKVSNDRQGGLNCLRAFENGGQHIQAFFGESGW